MADFPFEVVETSGEDALATWEELKKAGRGAPIILGGKIEDYLPACNPEQAARLPTVDDVLTKAGSINFPGDLVKFRREESIRIMAVLNKMRPSISAEPEEEYEPPMGEWPIDSPTRLACRFCTTSRLGKFDQV